MSKEVKQPQCQQGLDMTQGTLISTFFFLFSFWMLICPMWPSSCVHVCVYIACVFHMTKVTCVLTLYVLYDQLTCVCMYPNSLRSHMIKIMRACVCPYFSYIPHVQFHEYMCVYTSPFTVSFPFSRIKNIYMGLKFKALSFLINREVRASIHLMILIETLS